MGENLGRAQIISRSQWGPALSVLEGEGACHEVIGPRVGAELRSLYHFDLAPETATKAFRHDHEAVYYVISGNVRVESSTSPIVSLSAGGMVHIRPRADYRIVAESQAALVGGPSPVDRAFGTPSGVLMAGEIDEINPDVRGFHRDNPGLLVPMISADARLVVWYGAGAVGANMNYVVLEPGERNKEHLHRYSEDTIFILEGHGTAEDVTNGTKLAFGPGDVVTIPPGVVHAVAADRGERVISAGGPCPADLDMLKFAGVDVERLTAEFELA